jgi:hypothetical protein
MNHHLALGLVFFGLAITGLFLANIFLTMMIGDLNRKRAENNLVSYFGYSFPKIFRIFREYRSVYPKGTKDTYAIVAFALAIAGLIGVAAGLGFFN